MRIVPLVHGCDGTREFKAGEVLEGDSTYARTLLFNGLADPADEHAERLKAEYDALNDEEWAAHHLASEAHWDRGVEARQALAEQGDTADISVGEQARVITPPPVHQNQEQ